MKRPSPPRRSLGFTLIEVLTSLMVMSVVVRIGLPSFQEVQTKAEATRVLADFRVIQQAVTEYNIEHSGWPRDFGPGQVPPELAPYLNDGFSFNRGSYRLDWENWDLPGGLPSNPDTRRLIGISVTTQDRALGAAVQALYGEAAIFAVGDTYTLILDAL